MIALPKSLRNWGQLARLSLAPSAAADVACGVVLGHHGLWPGSRVPWLLMLSSLSIYHGAMVLNDWADREVDAKTRPERPIPSGRIEAHSAFLVGALALFFGLGCAFLVGPSTALWMGLVGWMAWVYTTRGRGPFLGPLLLAACRAGNLGAGLVAAQENPVYSTESLSPLWLLPLLYAAYVFLVSRLGRMEDSEDATPIGTRPRPILLGLAVLLLAIPFVPIDGTWSLELARGLSLLVAAFGASGLVRLAFSSAEWTRGRVMSAMGSCLRRLLIFTASATLLAGSDHSLWVAAAILAGYPASWLLRGLFPPS